MGDLVQFEGVSAYRAEPLGECRGALIVIHEVWGLVDHIIDVADRYAAEGYLVVTPDLLSVIGTTPEAGAELFAIRNDPDEEKRVAAQPRLREAFAPLSSPEFAADAVVSLVKAVDYLEAQPGVDSRIGVTGFCFGGTFSFALAAADQRVRVAVPWYGSAPDPASMREIACPVLAIYGELDESLIDALPGVTSAMREAGVDFTARVYDGAKHAFYNDSGPNYDQDASADAWPLALSFISNSLAGTRH